MSVSVGKAVAQLVCTNLSGTGIVKLSRRL
jgi:hypothetical protein